jgi:hypothetical protein
MGRCAFPTTIKKTVAKIEGKIVDADGKVRKTRTGSRKTVGGFGLWTGSWERFDLPAGIYTVELTPRTKKEKSSRQGR